MLLSGTRKIGEFIFKRGDLVKLKEIYYVKDIKTMFCRSRPSFDFEDILIFTGFNKNGFCRLFSLKKIKISFSQKEGIYKI